MLGLYTSSVLMTKVPVPSHALVMFFSLYLIGSIVHDSLQIAMHDFIQTYVSQNDFTKSVLPAMEKALLRSPEYALNGASVFSIYCTALC